jgi:hypothetical protein
MPSMQSNPTNMREKILKMIFASLAHSSGTATQPLSF